MVETDYRGCLSISENSGLCIMTRDRRQSRNPPTGLAQMYLRDPPAARIRPSSKGTACTQPTTPRPAPSPVTPGRCCVTSLTCATARTARPPPGRTRSDCSPSRRVTRSVRAPSTHRDRRGAPARYRRDHRHRGPTVRHSRTRFRLGTRMAPAARARIKPIVIRAYFGIGSPHPHLQGATVGDWPLNVFDEHQAAAELATLRAIAAAEIHNLVFQTGGDYQLIPGLLIDRRDELRHLLPRAHYRSIPRPPATRSTRGLPPRRGWPAPRSGDGDGSRPSKRAGYGGREYLARTDPSRGSREPGEPKRLLEVTGDHYSIYPWSKGQNADEVIQAGAKWFAEHLGVSSRPAPSPGLTPA